LQHSFKEMGLTITNTVRIFTMNFHLIVLHLELEITYKNKINRVPIDSVTYKAIAEHFNLTHVSSVCYPLTKIKKEIVDGGKTKR